MVKHFSTPYILFLATVYLSFNHGNFEKPYNERSDFVCDFDNITLSLVISNAYVKEQIVECLETYNITESLVISNSDLRAIPKYLNILDRLLYLDLSSNKITTVSFIDLDKVCTHLKHLFLNDNAINALRRGNLDCLESLEKLYLADNNLQVIENRTFSVKLKALDYINLVNNSLTVIDTSTISKLLNSDKTQMKLNASRNKISKFTNSINLTIENFSKATQIEVIFTHNNITTVDLKYYLHFLNVTHPIPQLFNLWNSAMDVRFNPFICDCALYPFAEMLKRFHGMDPDNPVFSITCGTPTSLEGMMIRKVEPVQFNCSVIEDCPDSCACTKTIAIGLISVDCSYQYHVDDLPLSCPESENISINIKSAKLWRITSRDYLHNVTVFDVSQCAIANIDPSIVEVLEGVSNRSIYLHGNNLETIPETFKTFKFSEGQILTIDGNPFNCDCNTLWMKKWLLSNKEHIYHQTKIICASGPGKGRPMIEVRNDEFVCQTGLTFVDILLITIGSLLGAGLALFVTACKIKSIQVFMISHFDICKLCLRKKTTRLLQYDIFIPHSCEDDEVVNTIVTRLENHSPPYKVCIGERNFEPGKTITKNILVSIECSHTSLLVISNNFLKSDWCNMEFREAHMRFLKDRNINMILIILEELDEHLVFEELRLYMETHVFIKYSDSHFWAKLLQSLPVMIQDTCANDESTPLLSD